MHNKNYTLSDLFSNKDLRGKLPFIQYKETVKDDGKISVRTKILTVASFVYDTAKKSGKPFYSNYTPTKNQNLIIINGTLKEDTTLDMAFMSVYNGLLAKRMILQWTASNMTMIRKALKESMRIKRETGEEPKLYLTISTIDSIKFMNNNQISRIMTEVMNNLFYGDNFPITQSKFQVDRIKTKSSLSYQDAKNKWQKYVGYGR